MTSHTAHYTESCFKNIFRKGCIISDIFYRACFGCANFPPISTWRCTFHLTLLLFWVSTVFFFLVIPFHATTTDLHLRFYKGSTRGWLLKCKCLYNPLMQGSGSAKVKRWLSIEQTLIWRLWRAAESVWCCLCKCQREEFVDGLVGWLLGLVGSSASVVQLNNVFKVIYLRKKIWRGDSDDLGTTFKIIKYFSKRMHWLTISPTILSSSCLSAMPTWGRTTAFRRTSVKSPWNKSIQWVPLTYVSRNQNWRRLN